MSRLTKLCLTLSVAVVLGAVVGAWLAPSSIGLTSQEAYHRRSPWRTRAAARTGAGSPRSADALQARVAALEQQVAHLTGLLQHGEHSLVPPLVPPLVPEMLPHPDRVGESPPAESEDGFVGESTDFDLRTRVHVVDDQHRLLKARYVSDKSLFVPFGSRGHYQPRLDGDRWEWRRGPAGPMSLSRMVERGALELTPAGLEAFVDLGTNLGNDRPKWPAPETEEDWALLAERQALFVELQGALLELGMLVP